jgi:adenylate kinase family enzyme
MTPTKTKLQLLLMGESGGGKTMTAIELALRYGDVFIADFDDNYSSSADFTTSVAAELSNGNKVTADNLISEDELMDCIEDGILDSELIAQKKINKFKKIVASFVHDLKTKKEFPFQTIIVDSYTTWNQAAKALAELEYDAGVRQGKYKADNQFKVFDILQRDILSTLVSLKALPINLILIAHDETKQKGSGQNSIAVPSLAGQGSSEKDILKIFGERVRAIRPQGTKGRSKLSLGGAFTKCSRLSAISPSGLIEDARRLDLFDEIALKK